MVIEQQTFVTGFDPKSLVGKQIDSGEILDVPVWHEESKRWRALIITNYGALAVVEFVISVQGNNKL